MIQNDSHFYCVIMAGGIGSRFWPISRESKPKQFLNLSLTGKSFIRLAYERFEKLVPSDHILVVSQARYKDLVKKHIPEIPDENILLEPYSKNTAPCVALASYTLLIRDPLAVMIAAPADHIILDDELFQQTMTKALHYASENDALITLGIVPDRPDTNFGYIQGVYSDDRDPDSPVKVKTFTEKPDKELAEIFIQSGEFYWNSGIFVWRSDVIRQELEKYMPEVKSLFKGWETLLESNERQAFIEKVYMNISKISIDYAVMEKTEKAWVFPAEFRWHDIGSWEALYSYASQSSRDAEGNVPLVGAALNKNVTNTIVYASDKEKLVAIRGLDDYIVVDTPDVLLISPRKNSEIQDIITNIALPDYEKYR